MTPARRAFVAGLALVIVAGAMASGVADTPLAFEGHERRRILQHGPWPLALTRDPTNRVSGQVAAIELGDLLFFEPRLSSSGTMSCVSCHAPDRGWADGLARGMGTEALDRNTPSLWNVGQQRWFGWSGAGDSLWAQNIRPLLDPREMGVTAGHVASVMRSEPSLSCEYGRAFGAGALAARSDDAILVDAVAIPGVRLPQLPIIHGDALCSSVAAASVIAS